MSKRSVKHYRHLHRITNMGIMFSVYVCYFLYLLIVLLSPVWEYIAW